MMQIEFQRADPRNNLVVAFRHDASNIRSRAALAAGRIGHPKYIRPLIGLLGDADWQVRESAAFALRLMGLDLEPFVDLDQARGQIARALRKQLRVESTPTVRDALIRGIGWLGEATDGEQLRTHLSATLAPSVAFAYGVMRYRGRASRCFASDLVPFLAAMDPVHWNTLLWAISQDTECPEVDLVDPIRKVASTSCRERASPSVSRGLA